jgi:hypothetical protein
VIEKRDRDRESSTLIGRAVFVNRGRVRATSPITQSNPPRHDPEHDHGNFVTRSSHLISLCSQSHLRFILFDHDILVWRLRSSQHNSIVIPGNPGEGRGPRIQDFQGFWIPAFAGMTTKRPTTCSANFRGRTLDHASRSRLGFYPETFTAHPGFPSTIRLSNPSTNTIHEHVHVFCAFSLN